MSAVNVMPLEQRTAALIRANEVRSMRARRKELWKLGSRDEAVADVWDLLDDTPTWAATWAVGEVVRALPRMGRIWAAGLLSRCGLSVAKPLGQLTVRQRFDLGAELRKWAERCRPKPAVERPVRVPPVCPDCGGPRSDQSARCHACYDRRLKERTRLLTTCPACGGRKTHEAAQCKPCAHAAKAAGLRARQVCPRCGGPKNRKSAACRTCSGRPA